MGEFSPDHAALQLSPSSLLAGHSRGVGRERRGGGVSVTSTRQYRPTTTPFPSLHPPSRGPDRHIDTHSPRKVFCWQRCPKETGNLATFPRKIGRSRLCKRVTVLDKHPFASPFCRTSPPPKVVPLRATKRLQRVPLTCGESHSQEGIASLLYFQTGRGRDPSGVWGVRKKTLGNCGGGGEAESPSTPAVTRLIIARLPRMNERMNENRDRVLPAVSR